MSIHKKSMAPRRKKSGKRRNDDDDPKVAAKAHDGAKSKRKRNRSK